jgi:hypothetical protein
MASLPGWESPNPGPTLRPSLFRATCAHLPRRGGSTQNLHGKYSDGGGVGPGPATFDRHRLTPPILPRFPLAHATHRPPFRSRTGSSQEILRFRARRANPARARSRHRPVGRLFCFVINRGVVNQSKKNRGVVKGVTDGPTVSERFLIELYEITADSTCIVPWRALKLLKQKLGRTLCNGHGTMIRYYYIINNSRGYAGTHCCDLRPPLPLQLTNPGAAPVAHTSFRRRLCWWSPAPGTAAAARR